MLGQLPVVILAGGLGTRLHRSLGGLPKGLAAIGNRPFLEIQIELLRDQGATQFVICVGHLSTCIRRALGDGRALGVHIEYSGEWGQLMGTAGALKLAEQFFRPRALVLNGDTYLDIDYSRLLERHHAARNGFGALATLAVAGAKDAARFGTVWLDEARGRVLAFREKDSAGGNQGWLNAGAYVMERSLLEHVVPNRPASLERETLPSVLQAGHAIAAFPCAEPFYDIGTPHDLELFVQHFEQMQRRRRAG